MSHLIASPFGFGLPYPSLFNTPRSSQHSRYRKASSPSDHFWKKALETEDPAEVDPNGNWLDVEVPAISSDEKDVGPEKDVPLTVLKSKRLLRFTRLRQIAFRSFKAGKGRNSTVVSTEIVSRRSTDDGASKRQTILSSWKIRSKGTKTDVKKMVAVVHARISSKSPTSQHPETWKDYHRMYANEEIDIFDPPLPPTESISEDIDPDPFKGRCYFSPRPHNESIRQLVVNRLGLFGPSTFDPSEQGIARARARTELAEQLEGIGTEPKTLSTAWERPSISSLSITPDARAKNINPVLEAAQGDLPPETLEQHPVFRKIVKQCREIFGTSISMLTIMDDDRQIFLAESGLGGMREVARDVTFCAHTILSGRKGFMILDTHKDWRFENGPLVQHYGSRFYAGVPLMAPDLDATSESDEKACPLGTLCVVDDKPRESFGVVERKKLVYLAEYARREIEQWFIIKMEMKTKRLENSREAWEEQTKSARTSGSDERQGEGTPSSLQAPEEQKIIEDTQKAKARKRPSFGFMTYRSNASGARTSLTPAIRPPLGVPVTLPGPSVFEDLSAAVKPKMQKLFDLATKLVGDTLELSFAYLLAVAPHDDAQELGRTALISGYNIPIPAPVFDAGLHLRALREPEGGLMYQNPTMEQVKEVSFPLQPGSDPEGKQISKESYLSSAILVAVGKEAAEKTGGFILAGFTNDIKRVFGGEDVSYMKQFAKELIKYTTRLKL